MHLGRGNTTRHANAWVTHVPRYARGAGTECETMLAFPGSYHCQSCHDRIRVQDIQLLNCEKKMLIYLIFAVLFSDFVQFGCSIEGKSTNLLTVACYRSTDCTHRRSFYSN